MCEHYLLVIAAIFVHCQSRRLFSVAPSSIKLYVIHTWLLGSHVLRVAQAVAHLESLIIEIRTVCLMFCFGAWQGLGIFSLIWLQICWISYLEVLISIDMFSLPSFYHAALLTKILYSHTNVTVNAENVAMQHAIVEFSQQHPTSFTCLLQRHNMERAYHISK